jgi:hypothetical protein
MTEKRWPGKLDVLLLKRPSGGWVGRCLQFNFVTQADTIEHLRYEIDRAIVGYVVIGAQDGRTPFAGLEAAPSKYWDLFKGSTVALTNSKLDVESPPGIAAPRRNIRVVESVEA